MANQKESIGIFTALAIVLVVMGLIALALNSLGWLPGYH